MKALFDTGMSFSHIKIFLKKSSLTPRAAVFGHNPAACFVYFGIWITVFCLGFSGWMMGLDAFWGEEWLEEVHGIFAKVMMVLVSLHLIGIAMDAYSINVSPGWSCLMAKNGHLEFN